jgi:outer membrane lipoprotein SlyB
MEVNKQLSDAAQSAYAKVKGQSGTPQAAKQPNSVIGVLIADSLGAGVGSGIGAMVGGPFGAIIGSAAGTVVGTGIAARLERFNQRVTEVTR